MKKINVVQVLVLIAGLTLAILKEYGAAQCLFLYAIYLKLEENGKID